MGLSQSWLRPCRSRFVLDVRTTACCALSPAPPPPPKESIMSVNIRIFYVKKLLEYGFENCFGNDHPQRAVMNI